MDPPPEAVVLGRTERVEDAWEVIRRCYEADVVLTVAPLDFRDPNQVAGGIGPPRVRWPR
jgi:hypothetical protein